MSLVVESIARVWEKEFSEIEHWSLIVDSEDLIYRKEEDKVFSGASMIKPFIAEVIIRNIELGFFTWDMQVLVERSHVAAGDGILKSWSLPVSLSLHNLMHLMLSLSDNTATNALVDLLGGTRSLNNSLEDLKYEYSRLLAWVGGKDRDSRLVNNHPDLSLETQVGLSLVSPIEFQCCFRRLSSNSTIWKIMGDQKDQRSLSRFLSDSIFQAHKTGTADGLRHDGGFFQVRDKLVEVYCFTDGKERPESVDDPACYAMARAMKATMELLS